MRLFAWLRPDLRLRDHVSALESRLVELEAKELQRELEAREIHDRIKRMLARMDTHHQREKQREEGGGSSSAPDDIRRMLLRAKYPHSNGG